MAVLTLSVSAHLRSLQCLATSPIIWPCHWYSRRKETPLGTYLRFPRTRVISNEGLPQRFARPGKIHPSKSPAGVLILIFPKPHGSWQQAWLDKWGLNSVMILNQSLMHMINERQERIHGARVSTKIDLKGGIFLIGVEVGTEWKIALHTIYGLYEYTVTSFDNASDRT